MNMNIIYEVPVPVDSTPVQVLNHDLHHQPLHDGEIPVIVNMQPVPPEPPQPPDEKKPIVIKQEKKKKEAIDGQAKEVIYRVIKFFESEKQNRGYAFPVENVVKRACAATGLSESTIKRIKRDGIRAEATQTKMTGPKKKRMRKCKVQLDYFQLCALRGIVNSYNIQKEVPTLGAADNTTDNDDPTPSHAATDEAAGNYVCLLAYDAACTACLILAMSPLPLVSVTLHPSESVHLWRILSIRLEGRFKTMYIDKSSIS